MLRSSPQTLKGQNLYPTNAHNPDISSLADVETINRGGYRLPRALESPLKMHAIVIFVGSLLFVFQVFSRPLCAICFIIWLENFDRLIGGGKTRVQNGEEVTKTVSG